MSTQVDQPDVEALRARLRQGEPVTATEWAAAEASARLAAEQQAAEAERAAQAAEAARQERIAALRTELPARLDDRPMEAARRKLEQAIRGWLTACAAYDTQWAEVRAALEQEALRGPLPADLAPTGDTGATLRLNGQEIRRARPQSGLRAAIWPVLVELYPRRSLSIDSPQD